MTCDWLGWCQPDILLMAYHRVALLRVIICNKLILFVKQTASIFKICLGINIIVQNLPVDALCVASSGGELCQAVYSCIKLMEEPQTTTAVQRAIEHGDSFSCTDLLEWCFCISVRLCFLIYHCPSDVRVSGENKRRQQQRMIYSRSPSEL